MNSEAGWVKSKYLTDLLASQKLPTFISSFSWETNFHNKTELFQDIILLFFPKNF
jgi:hypothetical protein